MLLKNARLQFIKHLDATGRSEETLRGYTIILNYLEEYFAQKVNGHVYLDEITFDDLDDFIYVMSKEKKWQINSVKKCHYTLSSFFGYCFRKEMCPKDISKNMEAIRGENKERIYLTLEECEQVIKAITHPIVKHIVSTMIYSGMRITECISLQIEDVDFDRNVFHIRNTKGKVDRLVPMHEKLQKQLLDFRDELSTLSEYGRFFATKKTGKVSAQYVNTVLKDACKKLGLSSKVTNHSLRHSFASNLINKNVSLVHVQKLLGHADLRTTSVYTHAKLDDLEVSVNLI